MKVNISKYDDLGQGITKINDKVCFVKYGLPKEELDIKILKENKNYSKGIIEKIIRESEHRIEPVCKYYYKCGGCDFLHMNFEEEKKFKINRTKDLFGKIDKFYETKEYNYRNKIILHVKEGDLGFYKEKSNDLININYCYLANDKINEIIKLLKANKDINFNGEVLIRVNSLDELLISISGNYKYLNNLVNSILIDNLIYNDKILKGNDFFYEHINNFQFKVNYKSFFQVNIKGLESIFNSLTTFLRDKKINNALDLYSGTSVLGILISKYVDKVTSIEINSNATTDAKENIKLNKINNLKIINGKVEDYINNFSDIDLIIVDPARCGLAKKTIDYLTKFKPLYLIYISCNIDSLKRDLKILNNYYNLEKVEVVDMFPRTNNQETICFMKIK
ncbi:MAG: class I SAM-dependent RNA methyltransferase [Bacilli bacterium]|nr:class I SAM-dependent RNA methyltransferase [Bacilli bacterium]